MLTLVVLCLVVWCFAVSGVSLRGLSQGFSRGFPLVFLPDFSFLISFSLLAGFLAGSSHCGLLSLIFILVLHPGSLPGFPLRKKGFLVLVFFPGGISGFPEFLQTFLVCKNSFPSSLFLVCLMCIYVYVLLIYVYISCACIYVYVYVS